MRKSLLATVLVLFCGLLAADWLPPRRKPHRRKGGESFPPLPLPATPLRRTEKKRPPAPPALIVRLMHGGLRSITYEGKEYKFWDWNTNPGAVKRLLKIVHSQLGWQYTQQQISFARLEPKPEQYPILFITGHMPLDFSDAQKKTLKEYVEAGGYVIFEACCGARKFFDSSVKTVRAMFPGRPLVRLAPDHPLFRCRYVIDKTTYNVAGKKRTVNEAPEVFGLDIGCRTAVFVFPHGISNGWDRFHDPGADDFEFEDAERLGVNLIVYCLSYLKLGRFLSQSRVYYEQDKPEEGAFVFAQLVYAGNWDPNPTAALNLLAELARCSPALAKVKRVAVDPEKDDLTRYPFLFLTGHDTLNFSDKALERLRNHIASGGFLLVDACCHRAEFTRSFLKTLKKIFPDSELKRLPADHPIYSAKFKLAGVAYTEESRKVEKDLPPLPLWGVDVNGSTRVIFCPYALGNGWEKESHPFTVGIESEDALKLGVNIITYCLTH